MIRKIQGDLRLFLKDVKEWEAESVCKTLFIGRFLGESVSCADYQAATTMSSSTTTGSVNNRWQEIPTTTTIAGSLMQNYR